MRRIGPWGVISMGKLGGQGNILEYALLIFFIAIILFVIIVFLTGFQIFQIDTEFQKQGLDRALSLSKQLMGSQYFTSGDAIFDDAKLTAAGDVSCRDIEKIFGPEWFFEVRVFGSVQQRECTKENYPDCNYWEFCTKNLRNISYVFPVNIFRKSGGMTEIGSLKVGIYAVR